MHIWNIPKSNTYTEIKLVDNPKSILWNPNGDLIGATLKNKDINIFEPKNNNNKIFSQKVTDFSASTFIWLDDNTFATISWNKEKREKLLKL